MSTRSVVVDGIPAAAVERPADAAELAARLAAAAAGGLAVVPVGGGRALGMGGAADRVDLALDTTGLDRVTEYSPADMTISCEAGATLEAVQAELGRNGQFLPLDPPGGPGHTLGGLVATGLSGPLRARYGSMRDFLIGLRVALVDGSLVSSGGRVVKNVSGYDMNKLHLGALGSLGVVVAASFKVFPKPLDEVTLEASARDPWELVGAALALPVPPVALEVASTGRVVARLAGSRAAVHGSATALGWDAAPEWSWEEHAARADALWARIAAPPGALRGVLAGLPAGARWWASPATGSAHWFGEDDPDAIRSARAVAEAAGGSLVLVAAPPSLKRAVGAWGAPPATLDVMRRVRDAFDPARTLSPGRYVV